MPHSENVCQLSIDNIWSCTLGNHGVAQMYEIITELLTALVLLNTKGKRTNIDSKITDVATCKVIKQAFLDVI